MDEGESVTFDYHGYSSLSDILCNDLLVNTKILLG